MSSDKLLIKKKEEMEIRFNLNINAKAADVYAAVSTQKGIENWWSKSCTVGEQVGEASHLKFDKQGTIVEMGFKTEKLEPNAKVVWSCTENPNPAWIGTDIIYEIQDKGNRTEVVFRHANFDEKWKGQEPFEMTKGGWEHFTQSLIDYCEKGAGQPW